MGGLGREDAASVKTLFFSYFRPDRRILIDAEGWPSECCKGYGGITGIGISDEETPALIIAFTFSETREQNL